MPTPKKTIRALALALGLAAIGAFAAPADAPAAAARADLAKFAAHFAQAHPDLLPAGFPLALRDPSELATLKTGPGFPVHTVDPSDVMSAGDLSSVAHETTTWRFLVRAGGRTVGMMTVEHPPAGRWQVVSYGGAALAQELDAAFRRHGNADRSNLRFVRVFQAHADFLEVTDAADGQRRLLPLQAARASLSLPAAAPDALLDPASVMPALRVAVSGNLADFQ